MSEQVILTPYLHKWVGGTSEVYRFWCPGCEEGHSFTVRTAGSTERPAWIFDGNVITPTFSPSLLYPEKKIKCHLFLRAGKIQFLEDCGHALAGKTVDMVPFDDGNF